MTKLKTFDQIINDDSLITRGEYIVGFCNRSKFREEAIKWIKYLEGRKPRRLSQNDEQWKRIKSTYWAYYNEQQKWIKHFFNITEEDLK